MRYSTAVCPALILAISCALVQPLDALTIYRIGGSNLPPPELATEDGVDFVQLEWADVDAKRHGAAHLLDIQAGAIEPQQLDPEVNLTPLIKERGGDILGLTWQGWGGHQDNDGVMFDGDASTAFLGDGDWGGDYGALKNKALIFDMGGLFTIERVRIYPRSKFETSRFVQRFIIGTSDGDPLKDGTREHAYGARGSVFDFDVAHHIIDNTEAVLELELPQEPIQKILFEAEENTQGIWEVAEFEIYGTGFAPVSHYVSNIIDLGRVASLGDLSWSAQVDPGAEVDLIMRSGDDDDPNTYWRLTFRGDERSQFGVDGSTLTLNTYKRLERGERAGITPDTENWSDWSTPYDFSAGAVALRPDKPRRYLQIQADIRSLKDAGVRLDYLQFTVSDPPVVSQVLAEIAPMEVMAGETTQFTYAILPRLKEGDLGFDSIEIETPAEAVSIDAVRIDGAEVGFDIVRSDEQGFALKVPRMDLEHTGELVEVNFAVEVFRFGTVFTGRVFDSEKPFEVHQTLTPGDADPLVESNTLSVGLVEVEEKAVNAFKLASSVFTPNGDGVNDQLAIEYELLNIFGDVPVALELYDVSGRRVGAVYRGTAASGRFGFDWDGRLADGRMPTPGLYLLRLEVDSDRGREALQRVVSLAY